jgi:hypothetical protein
MPDYVPYDRPDLAPPTKPTAFGAVLRAYRVEAIVYAAKRDTALWHLTGARAYLDHARIVDGEREATETGPWPDDIAPPEKCDVRCPDACKWSATHIMPPGHVWYWHNYQHTFGYLAHADAGKP